MAQLDANGHPTLGTVQPGDSNDPGFVPGTSGTTSGSTGSSTSNGSSSGASNARSSSTSFIPQYDPQLGFLTQYGNLAGNLGAQQYAWANNEFNNNSNLTSDNVNNYLQNSDMAGTAAQRDYANYNDTFNPAMGALVDDAKSYASPERVSSEMGRSEAGVAQNFDAQRKDIESNLRSFGVNPSDPRYAGSMAATRTAQAASEAGAGTQARLNTEQTGRDLRGQVLQQANLLPGQTATEQNVSMQGNTGAENAALGNTSSGALTLGTTKDYLGAGVANNKFQPLGTESSSVSSSNNSSNNTSNSRNQSNSQSQSMGIAPPAPHAFAEGGAIPDDGGGYVPPSMSPSGGAQTDDIPATVQQSGGKAAINAGEFVVPQDVVEWHGQKFFQDLIQKSRKMRQTNPGPAHPQTQNGVQHAVLGGPMQAQPSQRGVTYQQFGGGPNQGPASPAPATPSAIPDQGTTMNMSGPTTQAPAPGAPSAIPDPGTTLNMSGPTTQAPAPAPDPGTSLNMSGPTQQDTTPAPAPAPQQRGPLPTIANYQANGQSWRPPQPGASALGAGTTGSGGLGEFKPQRTYYSPNRMSLSNPAWKDVHAGDGSSDIPGGGKPTQQGSPTNGTPGTNGTPQQGIPDTSHFGVQPTMKNGVANYDLTNLNPRPLISGSGIPGDPNSVYGDPPGMGRTVNAAGRTSIFGTPQPGWAYPD